MAVRVPGSADAASLRASGGRVGLLAATDPCVTAVAPAAGPSMVTRAFWLFGGFGRTRLPRPGSAAGGVRGRSLSIVAAKRSSKDENRSPKDELKRWSK